MKKSELKALIKEALEDDALDELSEIIVSLRQLTKKFVKNNSYVASQLNATADHLEEIQNKHLS